MKKTVTVVAIAFALACLFLLLSLSMLAPALAQDDVPDLGITAIKPYHYEWYEDYDIPKGEPWFNLKNYVEVTVVNFGNKTAKSFVVRLYADGELIGSKTVDELPAYSEDYPEANTTDVEFEWVPEGEDPLSWIDSAEGAKLVYTDTNRIYTLKAVVDENMNELTKDHEVAWNGYMADAALENLVHDTVNGGILYTTGDGEYRSYESGDDGTRYNTYYDINYDLEIAEGAKLARLYIYYTWSKSKGVKEPKAPKIGVTLKTPSGITHDLSMEKSYNDIKGNLPPPYHTYRYYAWGTYAYDITDYMEESGTYVVSVTNLNDGSDDDFATEYSFAPPAILLVYEDTAAPKREYWINEGADVLMGGGDERPEGGFLDLEDCLNHAEFPGEHLDLEVEEAVLGVVAPWADDSEDDVIYFNGRELGRGLYKGYHNEYRSSEDIKGILMNIGTDKAQIGMAAIDVKRYLEDSDNEVIQGDDGDNMMPANAFLVITYKEEEEGEGEGEGEGEVTLASPNITAWNPFDAVVNSTKGESRTFNITVNQTVGISWQINGTEVQTNESVTEAAYTSTSAVLGTWNVSVMATNTSTGLFDMHTWTWHVTPALTVTPTPAKAITTTPTPSPILISTPAVPGATPTPTPVPTPSAEEKPGAEEKAPGFELVISLFILIAAAYLIRKHERK